MTERPSLIASLHEQRRTVERMLGSKHHCSGELSAAGRALIRAHERLIAVVEAASAVDSFVSENGPPFRFDRKHIGADAETALLILHDELNGVAARMLGVPGA